MVHNELIPESAVTVGKLQETFEQAFYNCSIDDDGDLLIMGVERPVYIRIAKSASLLSYLDLLRFVESATLALRLSLVNRINFSLMMARFVFDEDDPDYLVADYQLPIEGGVLPYQVVSATRSFSSIVSAALRSFDKDDIIA